MKEFIEKLIGRLEERRNEENNNSLCEMNENGHTLDFECSVGKTNAFNESISIVNELAEEYNNGWIPCEVRLPEIEADVLLSLRSLDVYCGYRANTEGCFYVEGEGYVEFDNIIAWQPLPAPYKKGE